jgi:hypothetical protein
MAKRKKEWPEWWEWELELRPYTYKRLKERDCTEIELRRMMEQPGRTRLRSSRDDGSSKRGFRAPRGRSSSNRLQRNKS